MTSENLSPRRQKMSASTKGAFPLLILCGALFALKIILSKAALQAGMQVLQLGILGNLLAAACLLPLVLYRREVIAFGRQHMALYVALGLVTFALPTIISNLVVTRVGAGYTASVYCLSPLMTMGLAAIFGLEKLFLRRVIAIIFVLTCVVILLQQQFLLIQFDQRIWILIGLSIPICAASGNIIRSAFWPKGMSPLGFSFVTLIISALMMIPLLPLMEDVSTWRFFERDTLLALIGFAAVTSLSFVYNFKLQALAGAVFFSQVGSVGTGFGVLMGALFFDETVTLIMVIALIGIVVGSQAAKPK